MPYNTLSTFENLIDEKAPKVMKLLFTGTGLGLEVLWKNNFLWALKGYDRD